MPSSRNVAANSRPTAPTTKILSGEDPANSRPRSRTAASAADRQQIDDRMPQSPLFQVVIRARLQDPFKLYTLAISPNAT